MDESEVRHFEQQVEPWRKALLDAANLIERDGLWRGKKIGGPIGSRCIVLALQDVAETAVGDQAIEYVKCSLQKRWVQDVYDWNDARTAPEVIAKLREVAQS